MSKKSTILVSVLCVISIILSIVTLVLQMTGNQKILDEAIKKASETSSTVQTVDNAKEEEDIQYVMYLGTNDKDTVEPVFTPDEAKTTAEGILIKHFGGYTIQEADGGWIDDDKIYQEYTLVIYLSDTSLDDVHKAADELIDVFHQSSVLIQANKTTTEFYAGQNND